MCILIQSVSSLNILSYVCVEYTEKRSRGANPSTDTSTVSSKEITSSSREITSSISPQCYLKREEMLLSHDATVLVTNIADKIRLDLEESEK